MLHGTESIIKHKVGLLNLGVELGNVARACRVMGVSRDILPSALAMQIFIMSLHAYVVISFTSPNIFSSCIVTSPCC